MSEKGVSAISRVSREAMIKRAMINIVSSLGEYSIVDDNGDYFTINTAVLEDFFRERNKPDSIPEFHKLCEIKGISYGDADRISKSLGETNIYLMYGDENEDDDEKVDIILMEKLPEVKE